MFAQVKSRRIVLSTKIKALDYLLGGGIEEKSLIEFYSPDNRLLSLLYHRLAVLAAERGKTLSLYVQEFGGLDPYLLETMAKRLSVPWEVVDHNLRIARAFKFEDALELINSVIKEDFEFLLVFDPYLHVELRDLHRASRLTWLIKFPSKDKTAIVFNRPVEEKFSPLGGNYHAHSVHILIRLDPIGKRGTVRIRLIKHPSIPPTSLLINKKELEGLKWEGQHLLSEWL
ncbi:MAG TPA: hypothetical protein EYP68_06430 [Candidatus Korarchaeota archaeon]|nr:hypothetical protein [Candidatus Korarchaeota archaeon]